MEARVAELEAQVARFVALEEKLEAETVKRRVAEQKLEQLKQSVRIACSVTEEDELNARYKAMGSGYYPDSIKVFCVEDKCEGRCAD